ncbi:Dot/Icm secretion system protein IcmQ [Legionella cardiaca]|uniref:Dot/Icm secretion system protein IcmQ n=1 Tax=Legionella cardiaca TaxID=1071983 RepID=A0ABY8ASH7_9GAMM|nr:Dot/Icm secretion system protein IcmQ [Legionella cardiaca]WED43620.1 Dot/Icm secretion system protein IcmQ [Legionella cardiaca]
MKDKSTEEQAQAILKALDEAIEQGPWEESNFLRVIGKNLREIRQNFANYLGNDSSADKIKTEAKGVNRKVQREGEQEVFIGLYSTEGNSIQAWERILANLPRQMISRPIYINEQDVRNLIKSKEKKINEAYLAIYINQGDILQMPPDKALTDRFGRPLLALKDKTLNLDNVIRFVHLSGTYHYVKGRLVKNLAAE